jgi:hypothetical protein
LNNMWLYSYSVQRNSSRFILVNTNHLMLFTELICVYCDDHKIHINTLCG